MKNVVIDDLDIQIPTKKFFAVSSEPVYRYVNGERTEDVIGTRLQVICPEMDGKSIGVKLPSGSDVPMMTWVEFANLKFKPYVSGRYIRVSASAQAVREVQ